MGIKTEKGEPRRKKSRRGNLTRRQQPNWVKKTLWLLFVFNQKQANGSFLDGHQLAFTWVV